jgi:hypothetical protein
VRGYKSIQEEEEDTEKSYTVLFSLLALISPFVAPVSHTPSGYYKFQNLPPCLHGFPRGVSYA